MKKIKVEMFEAEDGTRWESEVKCRAHELSTGSLPDRILAALNGSDAANLLLDGAMRYDEFARPFALLLEETGRKCAEARIASGGAKRKRKEKIDGAPNMGEAKPERHSSVTSAPAGFATITPTKDNPFPIHRGAGQVPAAE